MIWMPNAKMSWTYTEVDGLLAEVKIIDNVSHWILVDTETGVIIHSGEKNHPIEAMRAVKSYIDALIYARKTYKEMLYESSY